tara:strand:- start:65 stop:676 length:612 start_codon:yes stop_codon:yes gene_type:complete
MDLIGKIFLSSLIVLTIIDFLSLKKSKLPIKKCLANAAITFVASWFVAAFLGVILSMIFESFALDTDVFIIIALVLVLIFNYFRIKDRKIKNKKITSKENGVYDKLVTAILILIGVSLFVWLSYGYITISFTIWDKTPAKIIFGTYGGLAGSAATFANNIMFYIFGSFAYKVSSIILFSMGAFLSWFLITMGLSFVKSIFKKK